VRLRNPQNPNGGGAEGKNLKPPMNAVKVDEFKPKH